MVVVALGKYILYLTDLRCIWRLLYRVYVTLLCCKLPLVIIFDLNKMFDNY